MLIRPSPSLCRIPLLLLGAALLAVPAVLRAEDALPGVNDAAPVVQQSENDEGAVQRRGAA
jgi:hypothetical protein